MSILACEHGRYLAARRSALLNRPVAFRGDRDDAAADRGENESEDQQARPVRNWHTYTWSIKVQIFEARNMLPADFPLFGDPSSDPYCTVKIGRVGRDVVSVRVPARRPRICSTRTGQEPGEATV